MNGEGDNNLTARLLDEDKAKEQFAPSPNDVLDSSPLASSTVVSTEITRGEKQPPLFNRDWPFGAVFHIQFIAVITLGCIHANNFIKTQQNKQFESDDFNFMRVILPVLISAGIAIPLILLAFIILTRMGKSFIQCSIWTSAIVSFMLGVIALSNGVLPLGIFGLFSALIGCCYACAVKDRIPFAAANLNAGVSSIKSNSSVILVSVFLGVVLSGWITLWIISLVGVMDLKEVCDENNGGDESDCDLQFQNGGLSILWALFLFWTQQVFKNLIHTSVAGIVGTWYFDPTDASSFCSSAVSGSLFRSLTHSFGSICFGSLCVAILQTLDFIVQSLRSQRRNGEQNAGAALLLCCLDCLLSLLQGIMEYFNKWAFVYVGVYGYSYLTAGKKVMALFRERGWTVVINDNLIRNALGLMSFVIALLCGAAPMLFLQSADVVIFFSGFVVGLLLSTTVMSVIDSAVSTIIVCFAEAPEEFEQNHNTHSRNMREAWNKVYEIRF